jgi:biopolymer transport protein ExbD
LFRNLSGGRKLKVKKCFLLLFLLLICAASSLAQKRSAKVAAPAAKPQKEVKPEEVARISVDELILMMAQKKPVVVIDVRHGDYSTKIKGALQIPLDEIEARMKEIPRNKEIVTYCA